MATVNFKRIGALVKMEISGEANRYYNINEIPLVLTINDAADSISVGANRTTIPMANVSVEGVAVTDEDDFDSKIAAVVACCSDGGGGAGGPVLSDGDTITGDGTLGSELAADIASGTYTPTIAIITNLTTASNSTARYSRVGNIVTVSGKVDVISTGVAGAASLSITLPIASVFTTVNQANGTGWASTIGSSVVISAGVISDAVSKLLLNMYMPASVDARVFYFIAQYEILT